MATESVARVIEYPESDGKPVAETELHRDLLLTTVARLKHRYADDPSVFASGNLFVYYEEGRPKRVLAPDCFVAFGVADGTRRRRTYKVWQENGRFPSVVIEYTSRSTRREDLRTKFDNYQNIWRVTEYFLFDPYAEYLDPSLQGFRMSRGQLRPLKLTRGRMTSQALGVTLVPDGSWLHLWDTATGEPVLMAEEAAAAREKAAADRAQAAADRAQAAADQAQAAADQAREAAAREKTVADQAREAAAREKAVADRERAATDRALQAADRAQQVADRAQVIVMQEQQRRQAAEAEIARLKAELDALRRKKS